MAAMGVGVKWKNTGEWSLSLPTFGPGDESFSAEGVKSRGGKVSVPPVDSAGDGGVGEGAVRLVVFQ